MPDDTRDILIAVKAKVDSIHFELTDEQGKVPKLEAKVDSHGDQINFWKGGLALVAFLLLTLGGVFIAHLMGGK